MWPHRTGRDTTDARPARAHYAALRRASRWRRWTLAGAAGTVLGAFVGARWGWWLGLLAAAVVVAGLLIWDHRSGVLAAWPGEQGSHRLAAGVARLERRGWVVLCDPAIPGQDPRTGYLLIGPGGVFVVEHQVWPAGGRVATSPATGLLEVDGRSVARRSTAVRAAAAAAGEALSDALARPIPVQPVLAVHGLAVDRPRVSVGVTIVPIADLVLVVRESRVLSAADLDAVPAAAHRLFTPGATP
ncbi:MAG TPA: hypothetical protein VFV67_24685 [Actinophytocola sp.]|uniref:hypothetical protein n=1 Tax=Actinophytocola sp. TaxID=1872138 RepID=UPI002DB8F47F|nr:hypothetical protein [Actinophytocola sp.]HEU5473855.1 hypothetical protein [Actinophytocola sp.]